MHAFNLGPRADFLGSDWGNYSPVQCKAEDDQTTTHFSHFKSHHKLISDGTFMFILTPALVCSRWRYLWFAEIHQKDLKSLQIRTQCLEMQETFIFLMKLRGPKQSSFCLKGSHVMGPEEDKKIRKFHNNRLTDSESQHF